MAKKFLSKSIELSPSADAFFYRGLVYGDEQFHELAVKDFDAAIKLSPKNAEYYRERAWSRRCCTLIGRAMLSYVILRDLKGALRDAQDAELLAPGYIPAIDLQSRVQLSMGNIEEARRLSKIVVSQDMVMAIPDVEAHARACMILGDKRRAADDYALALCLARFGDNPQRELGSIYFNRAKLRYELRDYVGWALDLLRSQFRQIFSHGSVIPYSVASLVASELSGWALTCGRFVPLAFRACRSYSRRQL